MGVTDPWASYSSVAAKDGRLGGEAQLQQIDAVAEPDQVIPESRRVSSKLARDEPWMAWRSASSGFTATPASHIPAV